MQKDLMLMISHIWHLHRDTVDMMLEGQGISRGQPPILKYLSEHNGCIQRDLAESCHVRPATISSVLMNMEQSGYIERRPTMEDRRVQQVFLTEIGWEKHNLVFRTFQTLEQQSLAGVSVEQKEELRAILNIITENLYAINGKGDTED